jgi:prepilin-type N-terminal cleavage/methylation domain-containing protein
MQNNQKTMIRKTLTTRRLAPKEGFSLTEAVVTISIIGILSSIAYPNYLNGDNKVKLANARTTLESIPPIIGAHIDATGEAPTTWDELSSIAAVMTDNGPATGDLETPITLPNSIYDLSIEGPAESVYTLTATRVIDKTNDNLEEHEYKHLVKSCFNVSNGASDLRTGNLTEIESKLNCG